MIMQTFAYVACPMCKHLNKIDLDGIVIDRPFIHLCDIDEGEGCDRYFVAIVHTKITTESFAYRDDK